MDVSKAESNEAKYLVDVVGHVHIKELPKPESEIINGVNEEIQRLEDQSGQGSSLFAKGGPRCEKFIGCGIDIVSIVKLYIRYETFVHQGPRDVIIKHPEQGRVHMKNVQAIGIFKVAPNSGPVTFHLSRPGQKISATIPAKTIELHEDELLIVLGSVTVVIDFVDVMKLVWDGYSALPMGKDIQNTDVLEFTKL
ncbi:uncharacterized protein TRUGW13939_08789 [Talaromyces rugulosus]|uniref:Uncharacterized protein n=1 Tax=Talaromyces rugulosus TaxID=121627 RepID=A0A7H8R608_TALRU|nr:uncharacterized protein TRUGW13939_08789 [Talaromyces rugulosus]QKX61637.1 hypothetical protein TRUGW13939_08789 [Talaromyces rugulosus]